MRSIRAAAAALGRQRDDVLVFGQALILIDETEAKAQAKPRDYLAYVDIEAALASLSGWTGIDYAQHALEAPLEYLENDAGRTALASFTSADPGRH